METLQLQMNEPGSSLILVSTGAKLLRIKRVHFLEKLSEEASEHAKHLALKNRWAALRKNLNI